MTEQRLNRPVVVDNTRRFANFGSRGRVIVTKPNKGLALVSDCLNTRTVHPSPCLGAGWLTAQFAHRCLGMGKVLLSPEAITVCKSIVVWARSAGR